MFTFCVYSEEIEQNFGCICVFTQTADSRRMVASGVFTHVRDSSVGEGQPNYLFIGVYRRCRELTRTLDLKVLKDPKVLNPRMHPSVFAEQFTHFDSPPIMIM